MVTNKGCPDSWEDVAERTDQILHVLKEYLRGVENPVFITLHTDDGDIKVPLDNYKDYHLIEKFRNQAIEGLGGELK